MSGRIAKLEALLTRVQSRAAEPRVAAAAAKAEKMVLDSPSVIPPSDGSQPFSVPELDAPDLDTSDLDEPISMDMDAIPESGPIPSSLEAGLDRSLDAPIAPPPSSVTEITNTPTQFGSVKPTMEQLGQTVDLDEGDSDPSLELDEPTAPSSSIKAPTSLAAQPPGRREPSKGAPSPQAVVRPPLAGAPLSVTGSRPMPTITSFAELLDSSLKL